MDIIYLDFAKALDKVPHGHLIDMIKAHSIKGDMLLCNTYRCDSLFPPLKAKNLVATGLHVDH